MSVPPKQFELILVDLQEELCEHWRAHFVEVPEVTVQHGDFRTVATYDCLVSPANSYGRMDGGIDLAIRDFFGMQLQYAVQKRIMREFYGEQPVGTSMIVRTGHEDHPFLAHTPTMRVPADISGTDNVYNAMFAMLRAVADHNRLGEVRIEKVLCPGLGTATGKVSPAEAARQMAIAYRHFQHPTTNLVWPNLFQRDREIWGNNA